MSTPPAPTAPPTPDDDRRWITLNRQAVAGAFVSGLAHELNNPLQVVTGTVELLLARPDLEPDVRARLERIAQQVARASATRLERIAQQVARASATLLDVVGFVRERAGSPTRVDLRSIVERVLGLRRYPMARAAIEVTTDMPPMGQAIVNAKAPELAQALLNLVMNAEAELAGRPNGTIRVSVTRAADIVSVRVADNGPGVAQAVADRLFEPFVSSREADLAGGIGLTAARALVAANGGRLFLEPADAGATFVIELPAAS